MTSDELKERVTVEAQKRGLSVETVELVYKNRVKMISKTRLRINGFECRLHHLANVRVNEDRRYAMFGVTRSSLRKSDFIILLFRLCDSSERLLVIPSKVLLRQIPKGTRFKRFYVPHYPPAKCRSWRPPDVNWSSYEGRWGQLALPFSFSGASAKS